MSEKPHLELVESNTERSGAETGFETVAAEILTAIDSLEETLETYSEIPVGGRMIEAANDNEVRLAGVHRLLESVQGLREQYENDRFAAQAVEMIEQRLNALRTKYAIEADLENMNDRNPGAGSIREAMSKVEEKIASLGAELGGDSEERLAA